MELLKYYVVLRQDKGLLINDLRQGIHYMKNGCLTYLDNMKNGLEIEFENKNIMLLTYNKNNKNNKLHGKRLVWYNGYLSHCVNYSNDKRHGTYYYLDKGYLIYTGNYSNNLLHGTQYNFIYGTYRYYIHGEKVNKFIYDVWRYGRKLYSKIFF